MESRRFIQRMSEAVVRKSADTFYPRTFGGWGSWFFNTSRSSYNYAADVGVGLESSVLMATVQWLMRAFPEAPVVVKRQRAGTLEIVEAHPMAQRIAQPNDYYSGAQLLMATIWSWCIFGNAYWRIVQDRRQVRELWWVPPWMLEPIWPGDGSQFISHYAYTPSESVSANIPVDEVVHFRHGIDPRNMRMGLSPVGAVLREVWSDDEATNWVSALLRNMGVPGMIITPEGEVSINPDDLEIIKRYISSRFTGDHRGEPMAFQVPIKIEKLSHSPSEMDMGVVHNTAEERVTAMLGVPAAVVGFGAGLEQTKVGATMIEMVRLAWTNGVIPPQRVMASEIDRVLLPKYETNPRRFRTGWDYAQVQALQEDEGRKAERWRILVQGGIAMRSEARRAMGLDAEPADEVYLQPLSVIETGPGARTLMPVRTTRPMPAADGNGNGAPPVDEDEQDEEDREDDETEKSWLKQGTTDELINRLIMQHATRLEHPPMALVRLATQVYRAEAHAREAGTRLLIPVLERIGTRTALAHQEALPLPAKQDLSARITAQRVVEVMPMAQITADLAEVYQQMYELIAVATIEVLGSGLELPTELSVLTRQRVRAVASQRVALIDVTAQVRRSLMTIFEQAQAEGLDEQAVAQLIEEQVPAGRYRTVQTRATVIARTEGRVAANMATALHTRDAGLTHLLCFDARLGPTDETCELRNGVVVTVEEAQMLAGIEHPNGTLGFISLSLAMMQHVGVL